MIQLDILNDQLELASILDDQFLIIDTIGQGRYAKVKLAINIEDKQQYAIKIMKGENIVTQSRLQAYLNEVSTQSELEHKNIIKLIQCRLNGQYKKIDGRVQSVSYFVMKLAGYGELYQIIEQTSIFSEKLARSVFQQLIAGSQSKSALQYLHERGIVHRDIKSENILFTKNGTLKLADFGFCSKMYDEKGGKVHFDVSSYVGSPEYNPPELTNSNKNKSYNPESADLFASGIILFTMIMKSAPFKSTKNSDEYYRLFKQNKANFWQIFSELCTPSAHFKDLIEKILEENPNKRITLDQIKKHPWLVEGPTLSSAELKKEIKHRFDTVLNGTKQNLASRRNNKFQNRRLLNKKLENRLSTTQQPSVPKHLQQSIETIETINAKLEVKNKIKLKPIQFKYEEVCKNKIQSPQEQTQSGSKKDRLQLNIEQVIKKKAASSPKEELKDVETKITQIQKKAKGRKIAGIEDGSERSSSGSQATPPNETDN